MKNLILMFLLSASTSLSCANPESVCEQDDRRPVTDARIGKIFVTEGSAEVCTATLIGPNCAITAGHCSHLLRTVKFGQEVFEVETSSVKDLDQDIGKDWSLFRFKVQGPGLPGKKYGFFTVAMDEPKVGELIRIAGFGEDSRSGGLNNYGLQLASGKILGLESELFGRTLLHDVDTMGGNSGSAIIRARDLAVIGIHTHSGCGSHLFMANMGTLISRDLNLQKAIRECQR